jgi:hypothetical protein
MGKLYKGLGLVSSKTAKQYLSVYGWILDNFQQQHGCEISGLFPLSHNRILECQAPQTQPEQAEWIKTTFIHIKQWCGMGDWHIEFLPQPFILPHVETSRSLKYSCHDNHSSENVEKYYVDKYGRPVFYYDPANAHIPGYLQRRMLVKLADMLHKTALNKPAHVQNLFSCEVTTLCAAFLGFNHLFSPEKKIKGKQLFTNIPQNKILFSLAIFLKTKGYTYAQVRKLYGHLLSKQTLRTLKFAYAQLNFYKYEIRGLREKSQQSYQACAA